MSGLVFATGCKPQPQIDSFSIFQPPAGCDSAGSLHPAHLEQTARGYQYSFVVYLPPCYAEQPERLYPVLYLIPGRSGAPSNWFDAGADRAVDALVQTGVVPPLVIVGTENTDADPHGSAILADLMPYIQLHYRVLNGRSYRAVAGGSLGGIAAYRLAFQQPGLFASAGVFGSGLISGEEPAFEAWIMDLPADSRPRVFLNSGEQDPYMLERARVLSQMLEDAGLESQLVAGPGGHEYAYWISNFPAYFTWLAEDWATPQ